MGFFDKIRNKCVTIFVSLFVSYTDDPICDVLKIHRHGETQKQCMAAAEASE